MAFVAQPQDRELADLVAERLARVSDVAVGLGLHVGLVDRRVVVEELHDLLARPVLGVQAGVDDQADRAQHLVLQVAVVVVRILVEADLLAEPLGVQRPALDVRVVAALLAERRQVAELLLDGDLQVVAGHALVVRGRLHVDRQPRASARRC